MKLILSLFTILLFGLNLALACPQDSLKTENTGIESAPIPIEIFAGNKGFVFQLIVSKQFSPKSRFGFFDVTGFSGDYKALKQTSDFLSQSYITAALWTGIALDAGLSAIGSSSTPLQVRPTAGLQYFFANRNFLVFVLPRFDLVQTYNFETFAVCEYKLMLKKNWGIYSRVQSLFNYNTMLGFHEESNVYLRLGVSFKNLQFGIASDHDFYGSYAQNVNNFGAFIKTDLF